MLLVPPTSREREERVLQAGETLTQQGEIATEAYFVQSGTADVFLETSVDMHGVAASVGLYKLCRV
jgi:CRP-like cAMP-binding protein